MARWWRSAKFRKGNPERSKRVHACGGNPPSPSRVARLRQLRETIMIYRVSLRRSSIADAAISVEARDEAEAREIAEQRAADGLVHWTECGDDLESNAEPVK